ncbi:MAG: hypothetical protein QM764_16545 [Chitinophagaceae bacterium]
MAGGDKQNWWKRMFMQMRVCPGFTTSNIRKASLNEAESHGDTMDESKLMTAEECAEHILHAI